MLFFGGSGFMASDLGGRVEQGSETLKGPCKLLYFELKKP